MSRLHHLLILGAIIACIVYRLFQHKSPPPPPPPAPAVAVSPVVPAQIVAQRAAEDAATEARIAELSSMEMETKKRDRAASRTYEVRSYLRAVGHEAWHSVLTTNWSTYQALRQKAEHSHQQETPCTLCDGGGYMRFCVVCANHDGKCSHCKGAAEIRPGELCPACLGNGKCFLCFGSGRMPCPFCSDGTIGLKVEPPPREIPLKCPEPREEQAREARIEKERQARVMNTVSHLIEDDQSIHQVIQEEYAQTMANLPPSFWQRNCDLILLTFVGVLLVVLTRSTLLRHKREKEIRPLVGKYLADGKEAAHFTMPSLFEAPPAAPQGADAAYTEADERFKSDDNANAAKDAALKKFFAEAPEYLSNIRKALAQARRAGQDEERRGALLQLHALICVMKEKADCWDLKPVWQLASALDLLVKRLADKSKDATPSTMRTMAAATDLLARLCLPGVRADLIINPPINILAVDDDPLCLRAITYALEKADIKPDVAQNGEGAIILATEKAYDVIFMDINMPRITGLKACEEIHKLKKNDATPVVFVTVQSDFRTRTESSLVGGTDIIAKPFLMFEITVKALSLAMRKRLQLAASCEREVSVKLGLANRERPAPLPAEAAA